MELKRCKKLKHHPFQTPVQYQIYATNQRWSLQVTGSTWHRRQKDECVPYKWTADTQYIWEWSSYLSSNCRHDTALSGDQWLKLPAAGCDGELCALSSTLNCHQQSQVPQVLPEDNNTWSIPDRNAPLSVCSCLAKQKFCQQFASSKNGENITADHRQQD